MAASDVKIIEGRIPFEYPNLPKPCETWYKIYGDLQSSSTGRPLVMLHGGPGACHNYLLPLAELAVKHGVAVVFYDQVGCGNSTRIKEKRDDHEFWTVDLFTAEFDNVISKLGITSFDMLGQSWGGMLGASIAIRGHPGLKKIVIANSPATMSLWLEGCNKWRAELPKDVEAVLEKYERERSYYNDEYKKAVMFFYERHMCRIKPWPQDVVDSFTQLDEDDTVYYTMNGPSEFTVIGNLKTFDLTREVHKITAKALVINGEYDCATDEAVKPFVDDIPGAKWHKFMDCSHMSHVEQLDESVRLIWNFLRD